MPSCGPEKSPATGDRSDHAHSLARPPDLYRLNRAITILRDLWKIAVPRPRPDISNASLRYDRKLYPPLGDAPWHILSRGGVAWGWCEEQADGGPKMRRHDKRMLVTMGAVIASVALVSGVVQVPMNAQAAETSADFRVDCDYEAGNGGDLMATMKDDQVTGLTNDGIVDQGGCIINNDDRDDCVTPVMRDGGLGIGLGSLTLGSIAGALELDAVDAQNTNPDVECDVRETSGNIQNKEVDVQVIINDDAWGTAISGLLCTDEDGDNIACETGEHAVTRTGCDGNLKTRINMNGVDHLVLFLNGPANSIQVACSESNPVGGTMGGYLDPAISGVEFHFFIVS